MHSEGLRGALYRQDLSRLTRLIGLALALFGVALLVIVAYAGWSANRAAVVRERQLIENAFDDSVSRVLDEQKSIAWWDDAVVNLAHGTVNAEWADTEIGAFLNETYNHAEIYVLNDRDEPVYAYVHGERVPAAAAWAAHREVLRLNVLEARHGEVAGLRDRARAFEQGQNNYRELLGARDAGWSGHIVAIDGRPAVAAAISVVPNVTASLLNGKPYLLVSVVPVDPAFMSKVGASLLLPDLTFSETSGTNSEVAVEAFEADDGARLGYLSWTSKRPGQTMLVFILPLMALSVAGVGLMAWDMIRRLKRASLELADREALASYEAKHDQLSGLPNRHNFVDQLQLHLDALVQARRGQKVVVAYIDVDRFKDVNDTLGHQAGDALIMSVASRLGARLKETEFLARFGGDEFAVLRVVSSDHELSDLIARLKGAFEEGFDVCGQKMRMTASIGVALAPQHGASPDELMRCADIALYQGKNQGRDRAMIFCSEMADEVEQRRSIELQLRDALQADRLDLYYQPLVSCASGKITGVEALLRWRDSERGDVPPGLFVPIAEEAGLMPALGAWVLERAFRDSRNWPNIDVAINLSPVQFRHMDLISLTDRLITQYNIDPKRIVLEVTEGVMLESTDRNRAILDAFRARGFKVALDDFGTGYSSLRYLADFRFDKIKIDRAFVTGINERKRAMTIIQSVVTIGRGLGMDIVAEGVETEVEASVMRLVGVSELQGYYFSRPVQRDAIADLVTQFEERASGEATSSAGDARDEAMRPAATRS